MTDERARFAETMGRLDPARLVFVDESGVCVGERTAYGYARRGRRCVEHAPYRKGRRLSLIGWMAAPCGEVVGIEGSVTAARFEQFVTESLVPCLEAGDVVVLDNARIHSKKAVAQIEATGASVVWLPRYSPEYNAIEFLWSKVKGALRRARLDTWEALLAGLSSSVAAVRASDREGWIRHCGYHTPAHA